LRETSQSKNPEVAFSSLAKTFFPKLFPVSRVHTRNGILFNLNLRSKKETKSYYFDPLEAVTIATLNSDCLGQNRRDFFWGIPNEPRIGM
jgi:hypothetical protein